MSSRTRSRSRSRSPQQTPVNFRSRPTRSPIQINVVMTPETDCSICYNPLNNGEPLLTLPCGHVFHRNCICRWFRTGNLSGSCAICRRVYGPLQVNRLCGNASPREKRKILGDMTNNNTVARSLFTFGLPKNLEVIKPKMVKKPKLVKKPMLIKSTKMDKRCNKKSNLNCFVIYNSILDIFRNPKYNDDNRDGNMIFNEYIFRNRLRGLLPEQDTSVNGSRAEQIFRYHRYSRIRTYREDYTRLRDLAQRFLRNNCILFFYNYILSVRQTRELNQYERVISSILDDCIYIINREYLNDEPDEVPMMNSMNADLILYYIFRHSISPIEENEI
jgi:hypothetical protein